MRRDVQEIFRITPHHKQVMMFSATLAKEIRTTCKKFMTNVSRFRKINTSRNLTLWLAIGNFHRRRVQIDTSRAPTALYQA